MMLDLEIEAAQQERDRATITDIARHQDLAPEEIDRHVLGDQRHAFVVRREGTAQIHPEYRQLHRQETERQPGRQEYEQQRQVAEYSHAQQRQLQPPTFDMATGQQRTNALAFVTAHQGWWFFPVLIFEGINLHQQSVRTLLARGHIKRRWLELSLLSVRIFGYLALLFVFLPAGLAFGFLAVQLSVFGVYLGCSFAPNHKGMPLVPKDMSIDFFRRQVLMSRTVGDGRAVTFLLGGLNFQIEHHLFPSCLLYTSP